MEGEQGLSFLGKRREVKPGQGKSKIGLRKGKLFLNEGEYFHMRNSWPKSSSEGRVKILVSWITVPFSLVANLAL